MLPYQWQKLIMKEIFVEFIFEIEASKLTNFAECFLSFNHSRKNLQNLLLWVLRNRKKYQI